jgi:hypothetical protein
LGVRRDARRCKGDVERFWLSGEGFDRHDHLDRLTGSISMERVTLYAEEDFSVCPVVGEAL